MNIEPIKIRASLRDGEGEVRVMLPHPMESGQRRDSNGQIVPAHYITQMQLALNGRVVIDSYLGPAVSRNPVFAFLFKGVKLGDRVRVNWTDNLNNKRSDEATFAA